MKFEVTDGAWTRAVEVEHVHGDIRITLWELTLGKDRKALGDAQLGRHNARVIAKAILAATEEDV